MKKIFFIFLFMLVTFFCEAQEVEKTKTFNHYIGLQANQLFKQFLNLDASNTLVKNPYLLAYSLYYSKLHLGVQAGFGYSYSKTKDKLSPSDLQSTMSNISYRAGITRNYALGKKWEAATGLNYTGNYTLDKTVAFAIVNNNSQKDSTATISTSVTKGRGGELLLSLGLHLSDHIMIFTEASFHYNIDRNQNNVLITETVTNTLFPENDTYTLSASNSDTQESSFDISLPLALFITVKF